MALPTFMDCFLISCFLTLSYNFHAVFLCFPSYAFLVCHFMPVDYLCIAMLTTRPLTPQCSLRDALPSVIAHG